MSLLQDILFEGVTTAKKQPKEVEKALSLFSRANKAKDLAGMKKALTAFDDAISAP